MSDKPAAERCPDCGHGGWLVGRVMAECANCGHARALESDPFARAIITKVSRKGKR